MVAIWRLWLWLWRRGAGGSDDVDVSSPNDLVVDIAVSRQTAMLSEWVACQEPANPKRRAIANDARGMDIHRI
jgi:hypothetical protein